MISRVLAWNAARDFGEPLVPVRIQLDSPLLHHNPEKFFQGSKVKRLLSKLTVDPSSL